MEKDIVRANDLAQKSCSKWNKNSMTRLLYRKGYQDIVNRYWQSIECQERVNLYKSGYHTIDTYPWPYSDPKFANWAENNEPDCSTLVLDKSGFVVKSAASYCAYKIFEATGRWPQKKTTHGFDEVKDWVQFLKEAGYDHLVDCPCYNYEFVGVSQSAVVWFEHIHAGLIEYSTYQNKKYIYSTANSSDFIWVEII